MTIDTLSVREGLIEARALLAKGWTRGSAARTASGSPTGATDPQAAAYCALGALMRALWNLYARQGQEYVYAIGEAAQDAIEAQLPDEWRRVNRAYGRPIAAWNDYATRDACEVLDVFDRAIAAVVVPGQLTVPDRVPGFQLYSHFQLVYLNGWEVHKEVHKASQAQIMALETV